MLTTLLILSSCWTPLLPVHEKPHPVSLSSDSSSLEERVARLEANDPPADSAWDRVGNSLATLQPRFALYGNMIARIDDRRVENDEGDPIDDRFLLREVELHFGADFGNIGDAVVVITSEAESPGEYETGVEEAYVRLHSWPGQERTPFTLKLGRMRPSFGRLNVLHTHALPQTTRPRAFENFVGEEGFIGDGAQVSVTLGEKKEKWLTLIGGVFNGGAIAVGEDNAGEDLAFTARAVTRCNLSDSMKFELGGSGWHGASDESAANRSTLFSVDGALSCHNSEGKRCWVVAGEGYYAHIERTDDTHATPVGGVVWTDVRIVDPFSIGGRVEHFESLGDETEETTSAALFVNITAIEALRFRVGVERVLHSDDPTIDQQDTVFFEVNFELRSKVTEPDSHHHHHH
ncbi:MAG: hypothetical protein AAF488_01240 [Planctomycetota bacterium]